MRSAEREMLSGRASSSSCKALARSLEVSSSCTSKATLLSFSTSALLEAAWSRECVAPLLVASMSSTPCEHSLQGRALARSLGLMTVPTAALPTTACEPAWQMYSWLGPAARFGENGLRTRQGAEVAAVGLALATSAATCFEDDGLLELQGTAAVAGALALWTSNSKDETLTPMAGLALPTSLACTGEAMRELLMAKLSQKSFRKAALLTPSAGSQPCSLHVRSKVSIHVTSSPRNPAANASMRNSLAVSHPGTVSFDC